MRITYLTLDEVNRFLVRQWADQAEMQIHIAKPNELTEPIDGADAILLDLDYLPSLHRAAWLSRLVSGAVACRVLVHGHNISDAEKSALRRQGVWVCRGQLQWEQFAVWVRHVRGNRINSPPRSNSSHAASRVTRDSKGSAAIPNVAAGQPNCGK